MSKSGYHNLGKLIYLSLIHIANQESLEPALLTEQTMNKIASQIGQLDVINKQYVINVVTPLLTQNPKIADPGETVVTQQSCFRG